MLDIKKMLTKLSNMVRVTETQVFTYGSKNWQFRRIGKIVFIEASNDIRSATQGVNIIGTLRESMRPEYGYRVHIANSTVGAFLSVETTGTVSLYMPAAVSSASNNSFCGCYIAVGGYCLKAVFSRLCAPFRLKGGALNA